MRKDIRLKYNQLIKAKAKYDLLFEELDLKIKEIIDFEGGLTFCEGDGFLVINDGYSRVSMMDCIKGKTKINKLSEDEHEKYNF